MATSTLQIRVDSNLRKEADELFALAGLDMSSAVRLFLRQFFQKQNNVILLLKTSKCLMRIISIKQKRFTLLANMRR